MNLNKKVNEILDSTESLANGFEDIIEIGKQCKFPKCSHTTEPNCAIKKAISEGILSEERFNNYYRINKEVEHVCKQKNKTKAIDYMKQKKLFQR